MKMKYVWSCLLGLALVATIPIHGEEPRQGIVRLEGRVLVDSGGPFLGLGATYMQALRHCRFDRPRLHRELAFLATCGFNYVRVLSMVDWPEQEISPVDHKGQGGSPVAAWPDYDGQLADLVDAVYSHGLRTQLTIFADAQRIMPDFEARQRHLQRVLEVLKGREEKVILYEVANEAWQNGFPGDEGVRMLRTLGEDIAKRSGCLIALTSPPDLGSREAALRKLYLGSAATIATVHLSRDLRTSAGHWLPVIDGWRVSQYEDIPPVSSNEPIGPGASVASEDDPETILSAAAFAFLAGLPMYVFHSSAGVKAEHSFEDMPWLGQMKPLLNLLPQDLPNWERYDARGKSNPLVPVDASIDPLYDCGARKGQEFIQLALALDDTGREFRANAKVSLSVFTLMPVRQIEHAEIAEGGVFTLRALSKVCVIKGSLLP